MIFHSNVAPGIWSTWPTWYLSWEHEGATLRCWTSMDPRKETPGPPVGCNVGLQWLQFLLEILNYQLWESYP